MLEIHLANITELKNTKTYLNAFYWPNLELNNKLLVIQKRAEWETFNRFYSFILIDFGQQTIYIWCLHPAPLLFQNAKEMSDEEKMKLRNSYNDQLDRTVANYCKEKKVRFTFGQVINHKG